jgi:hypothetical protein
VVVQVLGGPQGESLLTINQQNVTWQDLTPRLIDIYKTGAQRVLFDKADGISWQDVAIVIDEAHNARSQQRWTDHSQDRSHRIIGSEQIVSELIGLKKQAITLKAPARPFLSEIEDISPVEAGCSKLIH